MGGRYARRVQSAIAAAFVIGLASSASAQFFTGRIDLAAVDATGARLPGVTVELTGPVNQLATTDLRGETHFLNLPVGNYRVKAGLQGFNLYSNDDVPVAAGATVPLDLKLSVAGTSEEVDVKAETPVVDVKTQTTSTHVGLLELQEIPTARDPWVVIQTVPAIYADRVNVGGSESGQQSNYMAKGALAAENTWHVDGVPVTDMKSIGASTTYYDLDMFQEMNVTTGGADPQNPTPGVQVNIVLKKGSNTPHGSARTYFENESLQGTNLSAALAKSIGSTTGKGNRTDRYLDDGFELGGPVLKDRWWGWGAVGRTDVRNLTLINTPDSTLLENYAVKTDAQLSRNLRAGFAFFRDNKTKKGRGAGPTQPPESTWDQVCPTNLYKGEANLVLGSNLFLTGYAATMTSGFKMIPEGGMNVSAYIDDDHVWHGSILQFSTDRPQKSYGATANVFAGSSELKFGFDYRNVKATELTQYPGSRIVSIWYGYPVMVANVVRDYPEAEEGRYADAYVSETLSLQRLTIQGGMRWDRQTSSTLPVSAPGVPGFTSILPAMSAGAIRDAVVYNTITPRVGVTYALDEDKRTIARASYSMFASQLGDFQAGVISPVQDAYVYYLAVDTNGNKVADPGEIQFNLGMLGYGGFDPKDPTALKTYNRIDPNLKTPRTHEVTIGIERELMRNFAVGATYTYRRFVDMLWPANPYIGVREGNYRQAGTLTGTLPEVGAYSVPYYALDPGAVPQGAGTELVNRDGYHQRYSGLEVSAAKRLADRWMTRVGFSTNDHREYFDNPATSIGDPTPLAQGGVASYASPNKNGGLVVTGANGNGKSSLYLVSPRYQLVANGMYEGPWGVNASASYLLRQGYGEPFFRSNVSTGDPLLDLKGVMLTANDVGAFRLPALSSLDGRVEKQFRVGNGILALDLDVFNVLNSDTVTIRQYDARSATTFLQPLEIMNPRIARVGVRLTF